MTSVEALGALCGLLARPDAQPDPAGPRQWDAVLRLAAEHGLLPTLWVARREAGRAAPLPEDALELIATASERGRGSHPDLVLQRAWTRNRRRCEDLLDQAAALTAALDAAGIETVALKGWHGLVTGVWPDPFERVMRDLDVLVPAERLGDAVAVLRGLGYVDAEVGAQPGADHQAPALTLPGRAGSVDLHRAVLAARWRDVLPARLLRAGTAPRATVATAGGVPAGSRVMSPAHAAVHLVAHAQLQEDALLLACLPLRAVVELAAMTARWGDELDWGEVRSRFDAAGRGAALDAHLDLARRLLGAPVPAPRAPMRAAVHWATCRALLDRPRAGAAYRSAVHLPRTLSRERMSQLYGRADRPLWAARVRAGHLLRAARHRLAGRR